MATEVTIGIRAFPYYVDTPDPVNGGTFKTEKIARRGETVELSDEDLARAKKFNAIQGEDNSSPDPGTGGFNLTTASVEDTAKWIEESKPTVDETVDAAEDDPNIAAKLLEAENLATGQQPRAGVQKGLQAIIDED